MNEKVHPDQSKVSWKPKKWIACILAFFVPPLAMLYLGRLAWAWVYLVFIIGTVFIRFTVLASYSNDELWWLNGVTSLIAIFHIVISVTDVVANRKWYSRWYGLIAVALIFTLPILTYKTFYSEAFHIPASSMMPTLNIGDFIQVKKWGCGNYQFLGVKVYQTEASEACQIDRGDLIVFEYPPNPKDLYIKRVMAVGGDHIEFFDKEVVINDQPILSEWIKTEDRFNYYQETLDGITYQVLKVEGMNHPFRYTDIEVPIGHLFVMGDNRDNSSDSRVWGLVPIENVVGQIELD